MVVRGFGGGSRKGKVMTFVFLSGGVSMRWSSNVGDGASGCVGEVARRKGRSLSGGLSVYVPEMLQMKELL